MLIRSLVSIVIVVSSFVLVTGQTPDVKKEGADKSAKTTGGVRPEKLRDIPFPNGVDLQFLIKELAKDMSLNVLFDSESRLENRKVRIELKNVTAAEALNYLVLQEGLYSEEVGPKTILVASRLRGTSIPQIGVGVIPLGGQLAEYFGVDGGILINNVRLDSPGSKAGLKAGDVIVGIDDEPVRGALGLIRSIDDKKESDITLRIVRDRRDQTVSLRLTNDLEKVTEYLLTSAAADFYEHQPPLPAKFRNVRLGHAGDTTKSGAWRLCGEFLPSEGGDKAEWTGFATIKTSGYEQYLGSNISYCSDAKIVWDTGDLSSTLKDKLDSTKKNK